MLDTLIDYQSVENSYALICNFISINGYIVILQNWNDKINDDSLQFNWMVFLAGDT